MSAAAAATGASTTEPGGTTTTATPATTETKPAAPAAAATPGTETPAAAAGTKTGEPGGTAATATTVAKAPEKYTLAIPDTAKDWVDADDVKQLETLARAKGFTNEQAQAVLEEQAAARLAQSETFRAETEADATYGGERLKETQRLANLALDRMAPAGTPLGDALRRDLVRTGFGNKLSVLAALARLGTLMAEDGPLTGNSAGARRDDKQAVADALYPTTVGLK